MPDFPSIMKDLDQNGILNYEDIPVKTKAGEKTYTDIYMVDRSHLAQCNFRDVTERKRAEIVLAEEKKFITSALNSLVDIFFVFSPEGKFLRWNNTLSMATGYLDSEIALLKPADIIRDKDNVEIEDAFHTTATEVNACLEGFVVTKDGNKIDYEFCVTRLNDSRENHVAICVVGRDNSERKLLEAQLQQAQKMEAVGTLAGGIAHDFNNILSVIMGCGEMVMETLAIDSPAREDMNEVLTAAERAANLTRQLLIFSRKNVVDIMPVNINELILNLQKMLVRIVRESIELHLDLATKPLIVMADTGMIEQVLMNLVANARDAMQDEGTLSISTDLVEMDDKDVAIIGSGITGRYTLITVSDSGCGIDAETQKRIFEPFFTTKGVGKGTGLGLAISHGIIKQHQGHIKVYSELGHGTVFKIYLPLSGEAVSGTGEANTVPIRGGNETILLAEDDPSLRELTGKALESFGYSVIFAENGEETITKFMENRERISLLLLDMIMPKINGKEAAEKICKIYPGVKILLTSGYPMDSIKTNELTTIAFDFIVKPFSLKAFLLKVREVLDK